MWRKENQDQRNKGIGCSFENKTSYASTSFNSPPSSIDYVDIRYYEYKKRGKGK